jgi:hypothetical protein
MICEHCSIIVGVAASTTQTTHAHTHFRGYTRTNVCTRTFGFQTPADDHRPRTTVGCRAGDFIYYTIMWSILDA